MNKFVDEVVKSFFDSGKQLRDKYDSYFENDNGFLNHKTQEEIQKILQIIYDKFKSWSPDKPSEFTAYINMDSSSHNVTCRPDIKLVLDKEEWFDSKSKNILNHYFKLGFLNIAWNECLSRNGDLTFPIELYGFNKLDMYKQNDDGKIEHLKEDVLEFYIDESLVTKLATDNI